MKSSVTLRFPNGLVKAFTLSYDDDTATNRHLIELINKYQVKGTFNLNAGLVGIDNETDPNVYRPLSAKEIKKLFNNPLLEVATHGFSHPFLHKLPAAQCALEILRDRELLESWMNTVITGHAYPYGAFNDEVITTLELCGITYARTTESHHTFRLPTDFLRWGATCHHIDKALFALAEKFVNEQPPKHTPWLFYVWGHAYEFERENNWECMDQLLSLVGNRDDVWYATNGEIYRYVTAWNSLQFSADGQQVYNPSAIDLWIEVSDTNGISVVSVPAGKTVSV